MTAPLPRRTLLRAFALAPVAAAGIGLLGSTRAVSAPPGTGSTWIATGSFEPTDLDEADHADWMAALPDGVSLAALSIPGTHDTMAYDASLVSLTQEHDLPTQLRAGIRAIDIRTRHFRDRFSLHHGPEYLHANFTDVVRSCARFLTEHPSETILMRVKSEFTEAENTRDFAATWRWYVKDNPDTADLLARHLWLPDAATPVVAPVLGAVRGKIVVLQEFDTEAPVGIAWDGAATAIQDDYQLTDLPSIERKFAAVTDHLAAARAGDADLLFINHLSATFAEDLVPIARGTLPVTVAKGAPGVTGMVPRTAAHLRAHPRGRTGVVIADFPTAELIAAILACNPV